MNDARQAYLFTILGQTEMYHKNYIAQKVDFAFLAKEPWVLRQQLDSGNQRVFDALIKETVDAETS